MPKLTVSSIRAQIAALEAKAIRLTELETKASVTKVRALMADLGLTMEHLGASVAGTAKAAKKAVLAKVSPAKKAPKKASSKRAVSSPPKYVDPKTGQTWTGKGRAPAWIASVKNRDPFLVSNEAQKDAATDVEAPAKKASKKSASGASKALKTVKTAAKKVRASAKKGPAKKHAAAAPAAKKASPRKAGPKKVAGPVADSPASAANVGQTN